MLDTRKKALAYLRKKGFRDVSERLVSASKFFKPEESWTGKATWWFDLPIEKIKRMQKEYYYLLGEWGEERFVVLKVPNKFLLANMDHFDTKYMRRIRLHLAAYDENWLVDERGKGKVPFSEFEVK
jgi:hypothetical protein